MLWTFCKPKMQTKMQMQWSRKNEPDNDKNNEEVRFAKSFIKTKIIIKTDLINLRNQKNLRGIISFLSLSVTPLRTKKPDIVKKIFADLVFKNKYYEKPFTRFNFRSFASHLLADLWDSVFYIFCLGSAFDGGT